MDPQNQLPTIQETVSQSNPGRNDVQENKDLAALSYAWVLSVFLFFWKKDSPFVHFHARQGMVLFFLSIVVWFVPFVNRVLELFVLAYCVLGFLNAAQGQWKDLPIIGDVARGRWSHVRESWRDIVTGIARLWRRIRHSGRKDETIVTPPPSSTSNPQQQ